ncbi:hypothetical protein Tco_0911543 [Tanacetum coccineum]|uniref:Reverse transcriptase domain-containing protein n=1 Tax=Tanacetum coccineum TaxID=301880 RepID=A0ABQ5CX41_9ASTR
MSLRTTVLGQHAVITELQAADRKRQAAITKLLAVDRKRQAQFIEALKLLKRLQTQMTEKWHQKEPQGQTQPQKQPTPHCHYAQLQEMIDQGVIAALAACDADRNMNGDDSHNSGTGDRRTERTAREFGHDSAYGMPWKTLMKMMTDKYCPRNEINKLEIEILNLNVKGGLPDMIHGNVVAYKPKTMQEAVEIATVLMDKKFRTFVERQTESKRKQDDNQQQQQ